MSHSFAIERRMSRRSFLWSTTSGLGALSLMSGPAAREERIISLRDMIM